MNAVTFTHLKALEISSPDLTTLALALACFISGGTAQTRHSRH